jgi:hypothetical protein
LSFETTQLELTVTVVPPPPARPLSSSWTIERSNTDAAVRWTDYAH